MSYFLIMPKEAVKFQPQAINSLNDFLDGINKIYEPEVCTIKLRKSEIFVS